MNREPVDTSGVIPTIVVVMAIALAVLLASGAWRAPA